MVNNLGIVDTASRVDEISHARLRRIFDVNVIGAFLVAGHTVRRMSTKYGGKAGVIVNMSPLRPPLAQAINMSITPPPRARLTR